MVTFNIQFPSYYYCACTVLVSRSPIHNLPTIQNTAKFYALQNNRANPSVTIQSHRYTYLLKVYNSSNQKPTNTSRFAGSHTQQFNLIITEFTCLSLQSAYKKKKSTLRHPTKTQVMHNPLNTVLKDGIGRGKLSSANTPVMKCHFFQGNTALLLANQE